MSIQKPMRNAFLQEASERLAQSIRLACEEFMSETNCNIEILASREFEQQSEMVFISTGVRIQIKPLELKL
ncbi:hypothetical protein HNP33_003727 [Comamonas odontotermitis]|uniref:Uncharacterized protein n=1 Tax=Comamonas odontotermitis TaxID=379895 RepID=A0ABR6RKR5_9BURK|nr:hypothetical protein [Comamonas odontotermitis]MBB6579613.1 hypothetical protein [Comamonas odontotermitis]